MIVEKVTPDEPTIRENRSYVEALCQYEEAITLYKTLPHDFERDHKQAFLAVDDAFHASLVALDAIVDAHTARKVAEALLAASQAREAVRVHFDQALTDFGVAYARAQQADIAGKEFGPHEAALKTAEEKVKAEAVRYARQTRRSAAG